MPPARPAGWSQRVQVYDINDSGQLAGEVRPFWAGLMTPYIPGDLDESGVVEITDLVGLLAHFGTPLAATYADGDLDCDGDVDLQDLAILLSNFGESYP